MGRILFLTTTNLAVNPRLVKELQIALKFFAVVEVAYFRLGGWSDLKTDKIKRDFPGVIFNELFANRRDLTWIVISVMNYFLRNVNLRILNERLVAYSLDKRSILLDLFCRRQLNKYDWVIAHNPGAFYPAYSLANRTSSKLGLDIEDYHPGENNDVYYSNRMLNHMIHLLPRADYCSFAAPLIQRECEKYFSDNTKKWFTLINGFPQKEFAEPKELESNRIRIVWFSQNISPGRGLEKFIIVLQEFNHEIDLHFVGSLSLKNKKAMLLDNSMITIHAPMSQKDLHLFLSTFTVGLVTDPPINRNREIAVTNKIIAYAQAGLFILAVSAEGHNQFLEDSELDFDIVDYSEIAIRDALGRLIKINKKKKFNQKRQFELAKKYSWELISNKLIEVWQN